MNWHSFKTPIILRAIWILSQKRRFNKRNVRFPYWSNIYSHLFTQQKLYSKLR